MAIRMIEPDWENAPTVYDVVVRGARLPVVDMTAVEEGAIARLVRRWTSMRVTRRAMAIVDIAFMPATGDRRGTDPSVTKVAVELSEDGDLVLHLMLWNGRRTAMVRHAGPYGGDDPTPYSLGVLDVTGTEWRWTGRIDRRRLFELTRADHPSMTELGTYDAAALLASRRNDA